MWDVECRIRASRGSNPLSSFAAPMETVFTDETPSQRTGSFRDAQVQARPTLWNRSGPWLHLRVPQIDLKGPLTSLLPIGNI